MPEATTPTDSATVLQAFRLGWALAEMRGRLHWGPPSANSESRRPPHVLPLDDERSWTEQAIEVEGILTHLAAELGVDIVIGGGAASSGENASARLHGYARALQHAHESNNDVARARWDRADEFFYKWDAVIQDQLAPGSFAVSSGYQLGRGLAEVYWALDPTAPDDPGGWVFLLGDDRLVQLQRLLTRLAAYFPAATVLMVYASLRAWGQVANDAVVRALPATRGALHDQLRVWHDVMLLEQTPTVRLDPKALLGRAREIGPVLRAFIPEVTISLISLLCAVGAAALFAIGSSRPALAPTLAVLSVFGVTSAGALAKAKGEAHSLFTQLQQSMDADVTKHALTLPPARAYLDATTDRQLRQSHKHALAQLGSAPSSRRHETGRAQARKG